MTADGQGEEDYDVMITNVPPNCEQQKQLLFKGGCNFTSFARWTLGVGLVGQAMDGGR